MTSQRPCSGWSCVTQGLISGALCTVAELASETKWIANNIESLPPVGGCVCDQNLEALLQTIVDEVAGLDIDAWNFPTARKRLVAYVTEIRDVIGADDDAIKRFEHNIRNMFQSLSRS